jgi:F-type H+-transporting ATPase subunit delta
MAASSASSDFAADSAAPAAGIMSGIAGRYADALFDLAIESEALEKVAADLAGLRAAIAASRDLRSFLSSPVYGADDQARAISAIADKAGFGALTRNFLNLVAKNRRLFAIEAMIAAFSTRHAAYRGEVGAEAISATPLNEEQTRRLRAEIEAVVGKAVNLSVRADPEILGGLIVKVGSTMIDSSLKTKLNRLKSVMKEA